MAAELGAFFHDKRRLSLALRAPSARSRGLAPAAMSPAPAAAAATPATTASAAPPTSAASAATATSVNNDDGELLAANVFPIEQMEGGETDVRHFLFAENEALIGHGIVRLRKISSGDRGCGCAPHQRKTQAGGTHRRQGSGFPRAFRRRSLLDHGRILQSCCESARHSKRAPGKCGVQVCESIRVQNKS